MNEYNKSVLKIVLDDMRDEQDAEFLREIEAANADPRFANNAERDESFRRALDESLKPERKRSKTLLRAASVFLALLIGLSVMTLSVKGFREKLWEFLSNLGNSSYSFMLTSDNTNENKLAEYEGQYIPTWIPEGYEVVEVTKAKYSKSIVFENSSGERISYSLLSALRYRP